MTMAQPADAYLRRAVDLAARNVEAGGGPFGAVLVMPDGRAFEGVNHVTPHHDPTAHAEVMAIRNACGALLTHDLTGSVLYASCEPCPMCLAASLWAHVSRVVHAADRFDAARAGFDDAAFYAYIEGRDAPNVATSADDGSAHGDGSRQAPPLDRSGSTLMPVVQERVPDDQEPFRLWTELGTRVEY